jgi:hypothetical protein
MISPGDFTWIELIISYMGFLSYGFLVILKKRGDSENDPEVGQNPPPPKPASGYAHQKEALPCCSEIFN